MLQSTPFARRETCDYPFQLPLCSASIHSLRKKGDKGADRRRKADDELQSTPFARRETRSCCFLSSDFTLQSTPFARRETGQLKPDGRKRGCFNPLPSQEGRRLVNSIHIWEPVASIHSLRKKGDLHIGYITTRIFHASIHSLRKKGDSNLLFPFYEIVTLQSTPFARRETKRTRKKVYDYAASIHSLRKKGDNKD